MKNKLPQFIVFICFFLSGAAGLIYEIVWVRKLTLVFGTSIYSTSTVLTAFMAGLSLGSIYFGKFVDRYDKPLKLYALLEVAIALFAILVPVLIDGTERLYVPLYLQLQDSPYIFSLIRFFTCFLILVVPTFLMGGTLPILSKYIIPRFEVLGKNMGRLYALNTFGAVLGCMGASFFLLPAVGVSSTNAIAIVINLVVAAVIMILHLRTSHMKVLRQEAPVREEGIPLSKRLSYGVLIGFALSGFCALGYEVLWARLFSAIVGSSVYAFGLILSTFLTGLALGSFIFAHVIHKSRHLLIYFSVLEMCIGLYVLLTIPLFDKLPSVFIKFFKWTGGAFDKIQIVNFFICFLMILLPTVLLGGIFPIVSKIYTKRLQSLGRSIGYLYGFNTIGAILGSFAAGFIFIPLFGVQLPIMIFAFINLAVGLMILALTPGFSLKVKRVTFAIVLIFGVTTVMMQQKWDKSRLYSGAYYYAHLFGPGGVDANFKHAKILFHKEGIHATVAVRDWGKNWLALYINGKGDASSGLSPQSDLSTQYLLAHVPLMLHPNPETAMIIGLGSGGTLGAATLYSLREIDTIEISQAVVEASTYFHRTNFNALSDPRVKLIVNDARTHILSSPKKYDVIISEPSNPWITGISNLFTKESYELIKKRINPDGLVAQWFHYYRMTSKDFKVALKTFRSVFPYVMVWDVRHNLLNSVGDVVLIGSLKPFRMSRKLMARKLKNKKVFANLASIRKHQYDLFMDLFMMDEIDIDEYTESAVINTDDRPILEFSAPKHIFLSAREKHQIFKRMNFYKMFRHMN